MKHSEQDRLLQEIISGEELSSFRQASLENGLALIRRQRRRRQNTRVCVLASLPLLLALGIVVSRTGFRPRPTGSVPPAPTALVIPHHKTAEAKLITDDELFALFPNRPLALIGKPGHQQLVFLDRSTTRRQ